MLLGIIIIIQNKAEPFKDTVMGWVFKQILCPLYEKYNYIYSFRVTFLQLVTITLLKMSQKHVAPSAKYWLIL